MTASPASLVLLDMNATYPLFDDMLAVILYALWWEETVDSTDKLPACVRASVRASEVWSDASLEIHGPTKIVCQDFVGGSGIT